MYTNLTNSLNCAVIINKLFFLLIYYYEAAKRKVQIKKKDLIRGSLINNWGNITGFFSRNLKASIMRNQCCWCGQTQKWRLLYYFKHCNGNKERSL
jgi:nucleosome binding factor SPN SPT16 subunit